MILLAFLATLSTACNLVGGPYKTYLCAGEVCTTEGGQTQECQSGCCVDGKCNADGHCAAMNFYYSLGAMVGVFLIGTVFYFIFWYFMCRHWVVKDSKKTDGADEEESLVPNNQ